MRRAIIKQTRQTKILQGVFLTRRFHFVLKGDNGEIIATGEPVSQKHNVMEVLKKYFPEYLIFDETTTLKNYLRD